MFAVPGWAVSADTLKPEKAVVASKPAAAAAAKPTAAADQEDPNLKKRKRPSGPNVNASNVADLYERVIEGRSEKRPRPDKRQGGGSEANGFSGTDGKPTTDRPKKVTLKEKKKLWKARLLLESQEAADQGKPTDGSSKKSPDTAPAKNEKNKKSSKAPEGKDAGKASQVSAPPAPASKLTPLQAAMREKLVSARFRHLNETLYTKPSTEAFELFQDSPEMFQEYHEGFRRQVEVWPENPVDGYIKDIKLRGRQKPPQRSRNNNGPTPTGGIAPLPRTNYVCTLADLGCGDAKLAESLQSEKKKLKLDIRSYDLQSPSALVTKADIANLPLDDGSVNVVVFCLALMGTNWLDFVEEAYRILHWKGELWVAEIKSRFGPLGGKSNRNGAPVDHSVGNRRKAPPPGGRKGKSKDGEGGAGEEKEEAAALAVEVDGADDKRDETDVSAFVEALRRRGFVLQGDVDLQNKMFVKMHFLKAAAPTVGKCVDHTKEPPAPPARGAGHGPKRNNPVKFIDAERSAQDESAILKPCVYKLR